MRATVIGDRCTGHAMSALARILHNFEVAQF
jgi:hypothetical protein